MAKCLNCGSEFEAKRIDAQCCSGACRSALSKKTGALSKLSLGVQKAIDEICKSRAEAGLLDDRPERIARAVAYAKMFPNKKDVGYQFTRLMATADRDQPNQRVSKPGDEDYPAQSGTKKCWCCGSDLDWDVLVCCGPCAWSGAAKRARADGWGPDNPVPKTEPVQV